MYNFKIIMLVLNFSNFTLDKLYNPYSKTQSKMDSSTYNLLLMSQHLIIIKILLNQ